MKQVYWLMKSLGIIWIVFGICVGLSSWPKGVDGLQTESGLQQNGKELDQYYETAKMILEEGHKRKEKRRYEQGHELMRKTAQSGHADALGFLGEAYLFGKLSLGINYTAAFEMYEKLANMGNGTAQQRLGFIYSQGLGMEKPDVGKAMVYYTLAASSEDISAHMTLGYRYMHGIGTSKHCDRALLHYQKVARRAAKEFKEIPGTVSHRIRLSKTQKQGPQIPLTEDDIVHYYQHSADRGDVSAQLLLGQLYYHGLHGIPQNYQLARRYFQAAVDQGNEQAASFLGYMYFRGEGIDKDVEQSKKYFDMAAVKAWPMALNGLGLLCMNGEGIAKDHVKAFSLFKKASEIGLSKPEWRYVDSDFNLGMMYLAGFGTSKDLPKGLRMLSLAAQQGHLLAVYNLGVAHAYGLGVTRSCHSATNLFKSVAERGIGSSILQAGYDLFSKGDYASAYTYFAMASEQGFEFGQNNAAFLLDEGHVGFSSPNETYARALQHWIRAAGQGSTDAHLKVGDYYYYGLGTSVDYDKSVLYYQHAEQEQSAQALFNLGYLYEKGIGLPQDHSLARYYYQRSLKASADAKIPATIALIKLECVQWIKQALSSPLVHWFTRTDWETNLLTGLCLILGVLVLLRQHYYR